MSQEGGRTKGDMSTKQHAMTDTIGRLIRFFMTAGQDHGKFVKKTEVASEPEALSAFAATLP